VSRILILCTGNSCRSQMTAAFLRVRDEIGERIREWYDTTFREGGNR
jgi:protein-tyrosine-phosphatase